MITKNAVSTPLNLATMFLVLSSVGQMIHLLIKKNVALNLKKEILIILSVLGLFYLTLLHEFLVSGVTYRSFWARPFNFLMMFFIIYTGVKTLPKICRYLFYIVFTLLLTSAYTEQIKFINTVKGSSHYLMLPRGKIFIGNPPDWIQTVNQTVEFLQANLGKDETFFALPYDDLYYYLTDKDSPSRQLIFFNHINIPPEQESSIIAELEKHHVNWVVLSNRSNLPNESEMGVLGQSYCPLIGNYLEKNFEVVKIFGNWSSHSGWAWNHAVKILKRK